MSNFKRQHPLMIPLEAITQFFAFLFPVALIFVFRSIEQGSFSWDWKYTLIVLGGLILLHLFYFIKWAVFTFRVFNRVLHIRSGILIKKERYIKPDRIQAINTRAGLILRFFDLVNLEVETAGGSEEAELKIIAIPKEEALALKEKLNAQAEIAATQKGGEEEENKAENIFCLSNYDLILTGITSGSFLLLFSILGAAFSQLYPLLPENFLDFLLSIFTDSGPIIIVVSALLILIFSWIISSLRIMVKLANFSVQRVKNKIQLSWGLIEKKQMNLDTHRVQAITFEEGLLRQPWGYKSIIPEVAGRSAAEDEDASLLFPFLRPGQERKFLKLILPSFPYQEKLFPLPCRARARYIFRTSFPFLILFLLLNIFPLFHPYGKLSLILIPLAMFYGNIRFSQSGWDIERNFIFLRNRIFARKTVIIPRTSIQSLRLSTNPLQRKKGLTTLHITVASSPTPKTFSLKDIDSGQALNIWEWFSRFNPNQFLEE